MAATISINFASETEVYDEGINTVDERSKKSVSAKLLQDVLGGGIVSGGYVKRTGDSMTGYLTLTSLPPTQSYHAASKSYVDSHSYTRRYYYQVKNSTGYGNGILKPGTTAVSGIDLYTNPLYFFDRGDTSVLGITRYLDVYRDGILQVFGNTNDYTIVNIPGTTFQPGTTAIQFRNPLREGTNIQVNIGNTGAYPVTFGVNFLSGHYGIATTALSGDVILSAVPIHYSAVRSQVATPTRRDIFVSPVTLSAFPLMPVAKGLFVKKPGYNTQAFPKQDNQPLGNTDGKYDRINPYTYNIVGITSDPDGTNNNPGLHRVEIQGGVLTSDQYVANVTINVGSSDLDLVSTASVLSLTRRTTSFDFIVLDNLFNSVPPDVYEISVMIY